MAVTPTEPGGDPLPPEDLASRQPRVRDFVRLKLRITGNAVLGQPWRIIFFVFGLCCGMGLSVFGFFGFAAAGSTGSPQVRLVVLAFMGTGLTLGWLFAPLLFFGVDETLDPARFALLPLSRRTLAVGMLAAACAGIPAISTLVACLGLVVAGAVIGGVAAAAVGFAGALLGLVLCVVVSRAVTSAFAGLLRSRRTRDLAVIVIALLASSVAPAQWAVTALVRQGRTDLAEHAALVLSWTPLGAPYVAVTDAAAGSWALVAARLGIAVATIAALLWWWSHTLESAMLGTASNSGPVAGVTSGRAVDGLFPVALRFLPRTGFGAMVARESRYVWRDPRRRAGLVSLTMASVVVPFSLRFGGNGGAPLPLAVLFAGVLTGTVLANQFGNDGAAYGAHLLAGVPGRLELRARVTGLSVIMVPLLVVMATVVALATGGAGQLAAAAGTAVAGFAVSAAVASVISVLGPYALPETTNPFAMNGGSAGAKGLLAFVGMFTSTALCAPVLSIALIAPLAWRPLALPVGLLWGLGVLAAGTHFAGQRLDRRGPEVLGAITPRR